MKRITVSHNRSNFSGRFAPDQNIDRCRLMGLETGVLGGRRFLYIVLSVPFFFTAGRLASVCSSAVLRTALSILFLFEAALGYKRPFYGHVLNVCPLG